MRSLVDVKRLESWQVEAIEWLDLDKLQLAKMDRPSLIRVRDLYIAWSNMIDGELIACREQSKALAAKWRVSRRQVQEFSIAKRRRAELALLRQHFSIHLRQLKARIHSTLGASDPKLDGTHGEFVDMVREIVLPWFERWGQSPEAREAWVPMLAAMERRFAAMSDAVERRWKAWMQEALERRDLRGEESQRRLLAAEDEAKHAKARLVSLQNRLYVAEHDVQRLERERRAATLEADRFRRETVELAAVIRELRDVGEPVN